MYILNIANPLMIVFMLMFVVLFTILGQEFKKSILPAILLFVNLTLLVVHIIQLFIIGSNDGQNTSILYNCLTIDFIFVLLSYMSYLWIDDIEAKFKNKKSIDDSLEWFWKKI